MNLFYEQKYVLYYLLGLVKWTWKVWFKHEDICLPVIWFTHAERVISSSQATVEIFFTLAQGF